MFKRKIYLSVNDWWKDEKKLINEDLNRAQKCSPDPEIISLMQELLNGAKVNTEIMEYFKNSEIVEDENKKV